MNNSDFNYDLCSDDYSSLNHSKSFFPSLSIWEDVANSGSFGNNELCSFNNKEIDSDKSIRDCYLPQYNCFDECLDDNNSKDCSFKSSSLENEIADNNLFDNKLVDESSSYSDDFLSFSEGILLDKDSYASQSIPNDAEESTRLSDDMYNVAEEMVNCNDILSRHKGCSSFNKNFEQDKNVDNSSGISHEEVKSPVSENNTSETESNTLCQSVESYEGGKKGKITELQRCALDSIFCITDRPSRGLVLHIACELCLHYITVKNFFSNGRRRLRRAAARLNDPERTRRENQRRKEKRRLAAIAATAMGESCSGEKATVEVCKISVTSERTETPQKEPTVLSPERRALMEKLAVKVQRSVAQKGLAAAAANASMSLQQDAQNNNHEFNSSAPNFSSHFHTHSNKYSSMPSSSSNTLVNSLDILTELGLDNKQGLSIPTEVTSSTNNQEAKYKNISENICLNESFLQYNNTNNNFEMPSTHLMENTQVKQESERDVTMSHPSYEPGFSHILNSYYPEDKLSQLGDVKQTLEHNFFHSSPSNVKNDSKIENHQFHQQYALHPNTSSVYSEKPECAPTGNSYILSPFDPENAMQNQWQSETNRFAAFTSSFESSICSVNFNIKN